MDHIAHFPIDEASTLVAERTAQGDFELPPPPANIAVVSGNPAESSSTHAEFMDECAGIQEKLDNYSSRQAWTELKLAAKHRRDVAMATESRNLVLAAKLEKELKAFDVLEKVLLMSLEEYAQFPVACKGSLARVAAALDEAQGDHEEFLVNLTVSLQEIIRTADQLLRSSPTTTAPGEAEGATEPSATYFFKSFPILNVRNAFGRDADSKGLTNPTVRKILLGHFVEVDKMAKKSTKHNFLIKCAELQGQATPTDEKVQAIKREALWYSKLQKGLEYTSGSTGCVWCFDVHPQHHYLVLEDFGQDLRHALSSENGSHMLLLTKATEALRSLHQLNIVHGDVKPQNFLYSFGQDGSCKVKLCDLECACEVGTECAAVALGTSGYYPPETFKRAQQDRTVAAAPSMDLFALGLVFWQVLTASQHSPLSGLSAELLMDTYKDQASLRRTLDLPVRVSYFAPLIHELASPLESKRPTAARAQHALEQVRVTDTHLREILQERTNVDDALKEMGSVLGSLVEASFDMPTLAVILPAESKTYWIPRMVYNSYRLYFLCSHTHRIASCGPKGKGYKIRSTRSWVKNAAPVLNTGLMALKLALSSFSQPTSPPVSDFLERSDYAAALDLVYNEVAADASVEQEYTPRERSRLAYETIKQVLQGEGHDIARTCGLRRVEYRGYTAWVLPDEAVVADYKAAVDRKLLASLN